MGEQIGAAGDAARTVTGLHSYLHAAPRSVSRSYCKPYIKPVPEAAHVRSWSVPGLCAAYEWPTGLTGGGVIAIVELGGGWVQSDMDQFFAGIGQPVPDIVDVSVDGTTNSPNQHVGSSEDPDGEVALDIQVAAAAYFAATGRKASIRMYWAQDIAEAVLAAAKDKCDVCSISWGSDEANWPPDDATKMEAAAKSATDAGMVVFAAAGDNDSSDGGASPANVDLPSSAPHVIGCGGTRKTPDDETVWNDDPGNAHGEGTGGGFSTLFKPMPPWQAGAPHGPGRLVPDVAANADPVTGYQIVVHGAATVVGGTSAVAPLYAGLFAAFGKGLGYITPKLWLNHLCFNDITEGDNGYYRARPGPDACTGLGSPIGTKLYDLFSHPTAAAGRELDALRQENARLRVKIEELTHQPAPGG